jgi:hypothetical protein
VGKKETIYRGHVTGKAPERRDGREQTYLPSTLILLNRDSRS